MVLLFFKVNMVYFWIFVWSSFVVVLFFKVSSLIGWCEGVEYYIFEVMMYFIFGENLVMWLIKLLKLCFMFFWLRRFLVLLRINIVFVVSDFKCDLVRLYCLLVSFWYMFKVRRIFVYILLIDLIFCKYRKIILNCFLIIVCLIVCVK